MGAELLDPEVCFHCFYTIAYDVKRVSNFTLETLPWRGAWRIRTAVNGFAVRCITTLLRHHIALCTAKVTKKYDIGKSSAPVDLVIRSMGGLGKMRLKG